MSDLSGYQVFLSGKDDRFVNEVRNRFLQNKTICFIFEKCLDF